ncbi:MAG: hypothetical protein H8D05_00765, partial [FCB group bacterium]|nr:hypothetical protein [FCB group bacterium]
EIGGVLDAIDYASHIGGIDTDGLPELCFYPAPERAGLFEIPSFGMFEDMSGVLDFQEIMYLMAPMIIR